MGKRLIVAKDHCDGCVWGKTLNDGVVFCPFVKCVRRFGFTERGDESEKSDD